MPTAFIQALFSHATAQVLCRTFIHSLWQGMIAAIIAGFMLICTKRSSARLRYNLLGLIFIGFVIVSLTTFIHELPNNDLQSGQKATTEVTNVSFSTNNDVNDKPMFRLFDAFSRFSNQYATV